MNDDKMPLGFNKTFQFKLIYIFRINDAEHKGCLKIGDATIKTTKSIDELPPNCSELNFAARTRIDSYTSTAGIVYELLHTELAVLKNNNKTSKRFGSLQAFRDYNVHDVLKRSGIKVKFFETNRTQNEWFIVDLNTAIKGIEAVKNQQSALDRTTITFTQSPIIFRPEQNKAIKDTINRFKTSNRMLWNAKMRFGKTLCALEVSRKMNFKSTIIITHRPVVKKSWFEDFNKIFYNTANFLYGSKEDGYSIEELIKSGKHFIYFASMQDLRQSSAVGGNFDKNKEIFDFDWNFIVIDEAHEGTQTQLGQKVLDLIIKSEKNKETKILELSGTPFNLITNYDEKSIFTWDYIMEQESKVNWTIERFGDSNPYEELPKMNIYTYHLEESLRGFDSFEDKAFNFREFFKIWTGDVHKDGVLIKDSSLIGRFVYENEVNCFLNLLVKKDEKTNYPFSTVEYRDYFRHTLWMLPGVKEAKALSLLLRKHPIFSQFDIINVAGDGDEEIYFTNALELVEKGISNKPNETRTITLSCGRLTTGVTVPEWTAVLMISGSFSTAASQYLQTIFRVQTPANIDGKIKENCFVFDFAPDRTLKMIAESVQLSARSSTNLLAEVQLGKFLNFCPVIAIDNSGMKEFKVSYLLQELKKAYTERVVKNGFDDPKLYNDELLKLDEIDLEEFSKLRRIIGESKQTKTVNDIDINREGFTEEEYEVLINAEKKPKRKRTEEEIELLKKQKKIRENKRLAISILRGISIRIPLLVYGVDKDIDIDITVDNFADEGLIDDLSWSEFMPPGIDRELFKKFSKYYDKDVFVAASRRIRFISKTADELEPTERVKKIASLFSTFKNPDKETVLTPWKVVNMHLSNTLGGYCFFDENFQLEIDNPRFVDRGDVTKFTFSNANANIMEMNSKSGLYPLYATYSLYKTKLNLIDTDTLTFERKVEIWDEVVKNNIFIICKTPMAKSITRRTLVGYRNTKTNTRYFEDLLNQLKQKSKLRNFMQKMHKTKDYWNIKEIEDNMKFNAIIGNPPYQELVAKNTGSVSQANPVYNLFVETATKLTDRYVSLITPSLWMTGGTGLANFRKYMIEGNCISLLHDYENAAEIFPTVNIAGGVSYFLYDIKHKGKTRSFYYRKDGTVSYDEVDMSEMGTDIFIRDHIARDILKKVKVNQSDFNSFMELVSTYSPFSNGIVGNYKEYFTSKKTENSIKIYRFSREKNSKFAYIDRKEIIARQDWIDKHKVFVSKAGEISAKFTGLPFYGEPGSACNETYLVVGPFTSKEICDNVIKYMNTSLFKFLVSQKKKTQNAARGVYMFVPLLDFSINSNINWKSNLEEIESQLYQMYNLTDEEIKHIKNETN